MCRRSSSTTPGLQLLETMVLREKKTVCFILPFKQQHHNLIGLIHVHHHNAVSTVTINGASADSTSPCLSHYSQENQNQDEDGTWRRSTVAYKRGSFVMSRKPVLHCEMATKEGTSKRARMAKMISLF